MLKNPKLNLATAAFAVAAASLFAQGSAVAAPYCNGQWHHTGRGMTQCYYLPTVSDGRVTGLQAHVNRRWSGGAVIGGGGNCRYLPTVAGGRVVGSHQVCG